MSLQPLGGTVYVYHTPSSDEHAPARAGPVVAVTALDAISEATRSCLSTLPPSMQCIAAYEGRAITLCNLVLWHRIWLSQSAYEAYADL